MKTEIDIFSNGGLRLIAHELAHAALAHLGGIQSCDVWSARYGEVITTTSGAVIGDLCYMSERYGWSHEDYMAAYGPIHARLAVTAHKGRFILVIPNGGDGDAPLGLGVDTGALSVVSEDGEIMQELAGILRAVAEQHRERITTQQAATLALYARLQAAHKAA